MFSAPNNVEESKAQPIYGVGVFEGPVPTKHRISSTGTKIYELQYEWNLKYERKENNGAQSLSILVENVSPYQFNDSQIMTVILEHKRKEIKLEEFKLDKSVESQLFVIPFDQSASIPFEEVKVFAMIKLKDIKYNHSNWANEYNLENSDRAHDVVLVFGKRKFYVHRNFLATWSGFFDRLFFGDFKEKNQKEIKIEEVDADDFALMMELIHPQRYYTLDEYDHEDLLIVLKLADRFEIPTLIVDCGELLSDFESYEEVDVMERLELADKHQMVHLQIACFDHIRTMSVVDRNEFFEKNRLRIRQLSSGTLKNLF